ncbi:hypothetical protein LH464_19620 [Neorhizobium sp. T786]|uniref:hypothetical protein n=1 Tax=Pseudorhizobium xiangyangii TaxID=2883104 RepID=UPI001CFFFA04|nr:hypothetical protein [Neorhizobium xiangyangii]MCB5204679.1 hypothetical protein [Neorhizobium xiangyangii]
MIVACLLGSAAGFLLKPLSLVPIAVAYAVIVLAIPTVYSGLTRPSFGELVMALITLNLGYLAGAWLRKLLYAR